MLNIWLWARQAIPNRKLMWEKSRTEPCRAKLLHCFCLTLEYFEEKLLAANETYGLQQ